MKYKTLKTISICAVIVVVSAVLILNLFPSTAKTVSDVLGLKEIVKVLALNRYEVKDNGYEATIITLEIQGLLDEEVQTELNERFKDNAHNLIMEFENDVKSLKETFAEETVHYGVISDYTVKTDNDDILAIDNYTYFVAGSSSTIHSFYTIDKKNRVLLDLEGLFVSGADYITPISQHIKAEMMRLNDEEDGMYHISTEDFDRFDHIEADQKFYINDDGKLVICFDKYEVAAGAQGSPEFIIPYGIIIDIVTYDGLR